MRYILVPPTEEQEIRIAMELLREPGRVIRNVKIVKGSTLEGGVIQSAGNRREVVESGSREASPCPKKQS